MKAGNIMSFVNAITKDMSIADAESSFMSQGVIALPVVDNNRLIGVITMSDIARALPSHASTLSKWEIGYLLDNTGINKLIRKPLSVSPDMDLSEVVNLAMEKGVYSFPVIDKGNFLGMIYEGSIIKYLSDEINRSTVKVEVNFRGDRA